MIYEYVIGGHHIQIEHKPPRMYKGYRARLWYFDCPRGLGLELDRDNGGFEWPRIAAWRYSHNFSYNESDKGVTMSLQKVCRQLRAETRLLVYKLNLFSFANSFVMRKWITSLKKAQALALTNICIPADYVFVKKHKDLLSGVTTFLDVEDPGERPVKVKKLTYEEFIDTYAS